MGYWRLAMGYWLLVGSDFEQALGVIDFDFSQALQDCLAEQEGGVLCFHYRCSYITKDESAKLNLLEDDRSAYCDGTSGHLVGLFTHYVTSIKITILVHEIGFYLRDGDIASAGVEDEIER